MDDVDWVSVVTTNLLVVRTVHASRGPQWEDDVTGLGAIIVATAAGGTSAFGQRV